MDRLTGGLALACVLVLAPTGCAFGIGPSAARPAARPAVPAVGVCGNRLCQGGTPWFMYGASEYESSPRSGIDHPDETISLAVRAHLNTVRIVNFYPTSVAGLATARSQARWQKVDRMIALAAAAHLHVLLDLSDYRNLLWHNCIDPYTYDWSGFLGFTASRRNSVSGATYASDPTIALVSLAGEPLPIGSHTFTDASGDACTITYTGGELTSFYARTLGEWRSLSGVPVSTGGLGYLAFESGIDWRSIFTLPGDEVCAIKTYARMIQLVSAVGDFCAALGKPWIDEEFGWQQSTGDAARAQNLTATTSEVRTAGGSGELFWNLGYQVGPTTYDVGPATPLAFGAVQAGAPGR